MCRPRSAGSRRRSPISRPRWRGWRPWSAPSRAWRPRCRNRPADEERLGARVGALETQIGALTNQIEMMGGQASGVDATPAPPADVDAAETPPPPELDTGPDVSWRPCGTRRRRSRRRPLRRPPQSRSRPTRAIHRGRAGIGATRARPGGQRTTTRPNRSCRRPPPARCPTTLSESLAALPDSNAQALYEQAYGDLLQRDYAAAETGFAKVVKDYPNDPLAGSAQYWVGETYYVRKQYKKAADSFLAAYRKYSAATRRPTACSSSACRSPRSGRRTPRAPPSRSSTTNSPTRYDHLRNQAKGEAAKAGCK